ncbi:MAG TPA: PIN domain-containing protein [Urbifossiella sp.]|nr:PIN domain-containing protein [Urbifossiella sp.]
MSILIDTSILGRLANKAEKDHHVAFNAIGKLHHQGEVLQITAQNLIEFRNFATRPSSVNGLGLTAAAAEALAANFEAKFPLLPETSDIYPAWKTLVCTLGIIGKQVHDARLVAVCHVNRVSHLLTFNVSHFSRMSGHGPPLSILHPANV